MNLSIYYEHFALIPNRVHKSHKVCNLLHCIEEDNSVHLDLVCIYLYITTLFLIANRMYKSLHFVDFSSLSQLIKFNCIS